MEKIKVAICYDFDRTLSQSDMQGYGLIRALNMNINDFWAECAQFSKDHEANNIMSYLYMVLKECKEKGIAPTREFFQSCGKDIEYYAGLDTWFDRINKFGEQKGVEIEHYIISSGMKEIVEGTTLSKYFKEIYACSYCYDEKGEAFWPALELNYTNKTQFLFRINKGIFSPIDASVNGYMSHEERRIPFENIIYIGDSETDIPSMKLLRAKKGYSIGVYDADNLPDYYKTLINQNRVDYIAKADYSAGSELETIIQEIVETIFHKDKLKKINQKQKKNSSV